jgi:hypothetical protein
MPQQSELNAERATLLQARRDIAEGERRVQDQSAIADRLRASGQACTDAERLLATFETTLAAWKVHEGLILQRIAYLEGKERGVIGA